jgi:hypothetical protein
MIAEGIKAPQVILSPEAGQSEGIVLKECTDIKPDFPKAPWRAKEWIAGYIYVIVPDKSTLQSGKVSYENHQDDERRACDKMSPGILLRYTHGLTKSFHDYIPNSHIEASDQDLLVW